MQVVERRAAPPGLLLSLALTHAYSAAPPQLDGAALSQRVALLALPPTCCSGEELRQLVVDKWGCSYDITLQRRGQRMYL